MAFIAAFLPVFIYLEVVYSIDRFSLISLRRLFASGALWPAGRGVLFLCLPANTF